MTLEYPPFRQAGHFGGAGEYEVTFVRDWNGNGRTAEAPRID